MRLDIQVMAAGLMRMQPCEAALPSGSERPPVPWIAIWPVGAAGIARRDRECFLDEELPVGRRGRGLGHHRRERAHDEAVAVDGHPAGRDLDHDAPFGRGADRLVGEDPPGVAARPPGEPDVDPAVAVLALDGAHHREDGTHLRQRPQGRDRLEHAGMRACACPCDVILEEDDEWLRDGHAGAGCPRRGSEPGGRAGRQHGDGERGEGRAHHPVNCEGPALGRSTASAQAR
jgi:hypothetical protein